MYTNSSFFVKGIFAGINKKINTKLNLFNRTFEV